MSLVKPGGANVGRVRVTVIEDGKEEWYELRTKIDWSQFLACSQSSGLKMETGNMLSRQSLEQDTKRMNVSIDAVEIRQTRLEVFLIAWSHAEPITPETLQWIPVETATKHLFPKIEELYKAQLPEVQTPGASADPLEMS